MHSLQESCLDIVPQWKPSLLAPFRTFPAQHPLEYLSRRSVGIEMARAAAK